MNSSSCIEQRGIVESADQDGVSVKISQVSACSDCHSKSSCLIFGTGEKAIYVRETSGEFRAGDRVGITITQKMGNKAIVLGYGVPFLLVILALVILSLLHLREWQAGLLSLFTLVPYYLILYRSRAWLGKTFTFTLKKLD